MNQPKFKFGERVVGGGYLPFVVTKVGFNGNGYYYHPAIESLAVVYEYNLKLCQEPQKKKLYAYKTFNGYINFKLEETQIHATEHEGFYLNTANIDKRAPEYDIEYPESK